MQSTFVPSYIYAEKEGPCTTYGGSPFHLRQSPLDGACGQHCLFMALVAMGVVKGKQVRSINNLDCSTQLGKVWQASKKLFFDGSVGSHLKQILTPLKDKVQCEPKMCSEIPNLKTFVMDELHKGNLLIVGMKNKDMAHWSLIVGFQGKIENDDGNDIFEPTDFLILDPSGSPLPYLSWNVFLNVKARPGGYRDIKFMYDPDFETSVKLDELVVLRKIH